MGPLDRKNRSQAREAPGRDIAKPPVGTREGSRTQPGPQATILEAASGSSTGSWIAATICAQEVRPPGIAGARRSRDLLDVRRFLVSLPMPAHIWAVSRAEQGGKSSAVSDR